MVLMEQTVSPVAVATQFEPSDDEEEEDDASTRVDRFVENVRDSMVRFYKNNKQVSKRVVRIITMLALVVYLVMAILHSVKGAAFVIGMACLIVINYMLGCLKKYWPNGYRCNRCDIFKLRYRRCSYLQW